MVTRYDKNGHPYREPPYTRKEEMELYRRFNAAPIAVLHPPARAKANQEDQESQPPAKDPSQD